MTDHKRLTAEERAEAKRLADAATPGPWRVSDDPRDEQAVIDDCCLLARSPDAPSWNVDGPFIAASRTLVPRLLADLEAVERERDEALACVPQGDICKTLRRLSLATELILSAHDERDTALAQVRTLAEALRPFTDERFCTGSSGCPRCTARDALKAAGVEP